MRLDILWFNCINKNVSLTTSSIILKKSTENRNLIELN